MDGEFLPLTFSAPIDVEAEFASVPPDAIVKGIFLDGLVTLAAAHGRVVAEGRTFSVVREYPLVEHLRLLVETAEAVHPGLPLREALRQVGRTAYPTFVGTMLGRVLFGVLGSDVKGLFRVVEKAYRIATRPGAARLVSLEDDAAVVRLESIYAFLDTYQVGVLEGVVLACGLEPTITMRRLSAFDAEFACRWTVRERERAADEGDAR